MYATLKYWTPKLNEPRRLDDKRGRSTNLNFSSTPQVKETTALRPVSLGMSEWVGLMKDVRRCKV